MQNLCFQRQILIQILTIEPNCFLIIRAMRAYNESSFRGIPSNYPLKSPSPDLKSKNAIGPTLSPQNANTRKSFNQFTPPNISIKANIIQYSTLPNYNGLNTQDIQKKFEKTQSYSGEENQSTNAKGQYNFQVPRQLQLSYQEKEYSLMSTGKKSIYQRTGQQSEKSSIKHSKNTREDLLKLVQEKDIIISELKEMINLMTENGRHLKNSQRSLTEEDYDRMKTQVKILTIENQKLAEVIDRLNQKNQKLIRNNQTDLNKSQTSHNKRANQVQKIKSQKQQLSKRQLESYQENIHQYQKQIHHLKQTLQEKQFSFQKQIDELINSHKSLALECKMYENQKERFSKENERLINLLKLKDKEKDTCYANYSYFDKNQFELSLEAANTQNTKNSQQPTRTLTQQGSNSRLSIQKIKAQYEENLKQYKQNVYNQVYSMFDTVNSTLEEINEKISVLEDRIGEMQRFRSLFKQRSHSISIEENDEEIKKSAIYIEEAPSSERIGSESKRSKQALSIVLEQSRRDYEKLELQLSHLRKEVDFYKETLRTRSQDNFKEDSSQNEEYIQSYRRKIIELESLVDELREDKETKEKQLTDLEDRAFRAEENLMTKTKNQSGAITNVDSLQKYDDFAVGQNETNLKTQILRLSQELQQKDLQLQKLRQAINWMQKTEDQREKELMNQIEHFQTLIKETEETFKISKQESQVEKQILIQQIQSFRNQLDAVKAQLKQNGQLKTALQKKLAEQSKAQNQSKQLIFSVEQENQQFKQQINSLYKELNDSSGKIDLLQKEKSNLLEKVVILEQQNKRLSQCEQNLIRIQKIVLTYKQSFGYQDIQTLIESTFSELEGETLKFRTEKIQLLKTLELQRDQSIHLKEINIKIKEQVAALEDTLILYKKELEEVRNFYESLLNQKSQNDPKQGFNVKSEDKLNKNLGRRNAKNKIQQLLMEENKKICNLVDSINLLGISNSSSSHSLHS